jgi:hypothetical protein
LPLYGSCLTVVRIGQRPAQFSLSARTNRPVEQIVGPEWQGRELIADFQLPIVDLIRAAASSQPVGKRF